MTESQRYLQRYWMMLAIAAFLYVTVAGVTLLRARTGANTEIFPIFSWDLFSVVPNETMDYGLRVLEVDGKPLEPPQFLEQLTIFSQPFRISAHMAIQELGVAHARGDTERARSLAHMLYENHLGGAARRVRFELVERRFDVLTRVRSGRFASLTPIDLAELHP